MTPIEAASLCKFTTAACPQQAIDEYSPDAWAELLDDIRFEDAKVAVKAVAKRQPFVAPAEIIDEVKRLRADRVRRYFANVEPPSGLTDAAYAKWYRETVKTIADGDLAPEPPARVEGHPDVIRELGQAKSIDEALAIRPLREAHAEAKRVLQEAEAERKRAEDARRAELDRMRREDQAARAALVAAKGAEIEPTEENA